MDKTVADPRGAGDPGPPAPVKTSQKKDGHHTGPQVSQVIGRPLEQVSGSATVKSLHRCLTVNYWKVNGHIADCIDAYHNLFRLEMSAKL